MSDYVIRNEEEKDFREVEELHRIAFWNVNSPGAQEHYLAHILRKAPCFIRDLDFVIEKDGRIIANIMYSKAKFVEDDGKIKKALSFGPISVHPDFQRQGYGKKIMDYSFQKALKLGYDSVVIFGHPSNYISSGFKSCKRFNICCGEEKIYPTALLVRELKKGCFDGRRYCFEESPVFNIEEDEKFIAYDKTFPHLEKKVLPCQEEFWIYSHSRIC